jgi:WD repeat-containing protein 23
MSAGWDGNTSRSGGSTIAKHEWKGLMKKGGQLRKHGLEDYIEKRTAERVECRRAPVDSDREDDDGQ